MDRSGLFPKAGCEQPRKSILTKAAIAAACAGLVVRLALTIISGNLPVSPFSGVRDQVRYQTLADSLLQGDGLAYFGQPTALRAPLYPIMLAAFQLLFGSYYFAATRILQFLVGVVTAWVCFLIARALFGKEAGLVSFALCMVTPTLILCSLELQTEAVSALLGASFLYFLICELDGRRCASAYLGITSGLSLLTRFNFLLLPLFGIAVSAWFRKSVKDALIVGFLAGTIVAPWIIRNLIVFHGSVVYSSHGGINLLEGILTPEGRAIKEQDERFRASVGWFHTEIEVNEPSRLRLGPEDQLDRQARTAAVEAWRKMDLSSTLSLLKSKFGWFWLSLDQYGETSSFSRSQRSIRRIGVLVYWVLLLLSAVGLLFLARFSRVRALLLSAYLLFITVAHLPFVMNTRLRIPFIDPLLAVLAAGALVMMCRPILGTDESGKYLESSLQAK